MRTGIDGGSLKWTVSLTISYMHEVHAPHGPLHGWRDLAVHLLTITAGLLIALGLEGAVEAVHHHNVAHEARENIRKELADNLGDATKDVDKVQRAIVALDATLASARQRRDHQAAGKANVDVSWSEFQSAAWLTARESGALAHMPLDEVQKYAGLYAKQELLQAEAYAVIRSALSTLAPLLIESTPDHASPDDLRLVMLRSADTRMQLVGLKQLVIGLRQDYMAAGVGEGSGDSQARPASDPR